MKTESCELPGADVKDAKIQAMAKPRMRFVTEKTVTKPIRVTFTMKSGETVSFKAIKTFKAPKVVRFRAKKKK